MEKGYKRVDDFSKREPPAGTKDLVPFSKIPADALVSLPISTQRESYFAVLYDEGKAFKRGTDDTLAGRSLCRV